MATMNENASATLADSMQLGFTHAMERVAEVNLNPLSTLVDQVSQSDWESWDASNEIANVVDPHGVDGYEDDGEGVPAAA